MVERRSSIRRRVVGSATAVVAVALVIGAIFFVLLFRWTLLDGLRASAEADASAIAERIASTGVAQLSETERDDDDRLLQLVADGRVVDSNDVASLLIDVADDWVTVTVDDESYLVVFEEAEIADDEVTVVVGAELDEVDQSLATVVPLVALAVPLLLALVALVTWVVVGRALRPVEAMRTELESITASRLDRRIVGPGGGDEIDRLATTMNGALERLDSSQRAQARFVSDASHELRSPLASLRQYAEIATSYPDRMRASELADAITDEGGRLESIVRGMLLLTRADEGALDQSRRDVDLDDLLLAEVNRLRASTTLTVDASGISPCRVLGDEAMLAQVVRNLADNAVRHARSIVTRSVRAEGGRAILRVEDDGDGIADDDRERVFDRFVRLDDARARETGGSGLGLAIVRELVVLHGGTVRVRAGAAGGALIEVDLPLSF